MSTRVYVVEDTDAPGKPPRLVDASYEHSALRHVSQGRYKARIATKRDLVALMGQGIKVEFADPLRGETQQALQLESAQLPELPADVKTTVVPLKATTS